MIVAGIGLMLSGIMINRNPQVLHATVSASFSPHATDILMKSLIVLGALFTFVAGTRLSMLLRPPHMIFLGLALAVGAVVGPVEAAHLFPAFRSYNWNAATLLPFFVLRMVGIIFFSAGILRWVVSSASRS
jgi:hypothetical protein